MVLTSTHWGTYEVTTKEGRIDDVRPFKLDPDPSPIGYSLRDALTHPTRVLRPMVRKGWLDNGPAGTGHGRGKESFVPVSWQEATRLVAAELSRVKRAHGSESIFGGSYGWASAGRFHHAQDQLKRFLNLHGGCTSAVNSYSYGAGRVVVPHIVGGEYRESHSNFTSWDVIAANTGLVVTFGGVPYKNGQIEAGGLGRHQMPQWMRTCRDAGVTFINVSPMRGDMADELRPEWQPLRPNTDVALMLGVAHTLVEEGLCNRAFLERYTSGYARFEAYLLGKADGLPKTAEWAARVCAVAPETIRALARRMAGTRTFVCVNWSLQRADHGEQPYWMAITLACMLGQVGLPGGGYGFGYGATATIGVPGPRLSGPSFSQGKNAVDCFIPVARIVELLEKPGGTLDYDGRKLRLPDIRLVYWAGGNPFHHHQDINRLRRAWQRPDTVIVHEQVWNALSKHADIVLPATYGLERNDLGVSSRDSHFVASKKAVEPFGEARNDHDMLADIAEHLGFRSEFTENLSEMEWIRRIYDGFRERYQWMPTFEEFWDLDHIEVPVDRSTRSSIVLLDAFRADPVRNRLSTPSGRIEIFSKHVASFGYDDCPGHAAWLEPVEWLGSDKARAFPLHLLSNQPATRLHSQLDFGRHSQAHKIAGRERILIHPHDAASRGIATADVVRAFNERGQCLAGAFVTDEVIAGVVQMATGAWYDPEDPADPMSLDLNGNPNVLTFDKGTSRLAQGANANSCLVEIEKFLGEVPPSRAYLPPELDVHPAVPEPKSAAE
jgi:biotin/methionine sulfoxide reductase